MVTHIVLLCGWRECMVRIAAKAGKRDVEVLQEAHNEDVIDSWNDRCVHSGVDGREATCNEDVDEVFQS